MRPRAIVISASGDHRLPRAKVRDAAIRAGSTVFCTSRRGKEVVLGTAATQGPIDHEESNAPCCHAIFDCGTQQRGSVVLHLTEAGIHASHAACLSGHGAFGSPVIEIRQHVIDPSPAMSLLFEGELRRHLRWVKKHLDDIHDERCKRTERDLTGTSAPVKQAQIEGAARADGLESLAANVAEVLRAGMQRGLFWARPGNPHRRSSWVAYRKATSADVDAMMDLLSKDGLILFKPGVRPPISDPESVLSTVDAEGIARLADARRLLPRGPFEDTLWPLLVKQLARDWHGFRHNTESRIIRWKRLGFAIHRRRGGLDGDAARHYQRFFRKSKRRSPGR